MRFASRSLGVALASLGLLGVFGCAEDNEGNVKAVQGKTDETTPTASQYSQFGKSKAGTTNPYAGGGAYPGGKKAKGGAAK